MPVAVPLSSRFLLPIIVSTLRCATSSAMADTSTGQFKSSRSFYWMTRYYSITGIRMTWSFFESGHGKGEHDGAGRLGYSDTEEKVMKNNNDQNKELGKLASGIMPHILNMYNCIATAEDFEIYAPNATFEDPLMCAHGVKQIKSAFYSIPKVFSEAKMGEYTVQEQETSPGNGEISIDNVQHYKLMGKNIDMISLIKLQVENGKVIRHEDLWDKKPLWSRQTVKTPLVGRAVEKLRRGNMFLTHVLMGCGKDPKP